MTFRIVGRILIAIFFIIFLYFSYSSATKRPEAGTNGGTSVPALGPDTQPLTTQQASQPYYPPDDSLRKGEPRVPPEFRNGTASLDQARAWAKVMLDGSGEIRVAEEELIPGGRKGIFIYNTSLGGSGGNFFMVFDKTPNGFLYLGDLYFGKYWASPPDAKGHLRAVTYWHMSVSEGILSLWVRKGSAYKEVRKITVHPGYDWTTEDKRIYNSLSSGNHVSDSWIETTFGVKSK